MFYNFVWITSTEHYNNTYCRSYYTKKIILHSDYNNV